jgi:hypothetical protein
MRFRITLVFAAMLAGCAGLNPADKNAQKEFTYDFTVPGKSQSQLWHSARDYFAEAYGDSRSVFRIMDENDGTIIGKGLAPWSLAGNNCQTEYHIRFAAKEGKSRLQFELIEGVPPLSPCGGYPWPSKDGYDQIVASFKKSAQSLEGALNGAGSSSKLKDF